MSAGHGTYAYADINTLKTAAEIRAGSQIRVGIRLELARPKPVDQGLHFQYLGHLKEPWNHRSARLQGCEVKVFVLKGSVFSRTKGEVNVPVLSPPLPTECKPRVLER